jgi:hypothetical protein
MNSSVSKAVPAPPCPKQRGNKTGVVIRCKNLEALQERPTGHESAADYDRTGPGEADQNVSTSRRRMSSLHRGQPSVDSVP